MDKKKNISRRKEGNIMKHDISDNLYKKAVELMPGGVNSPVSGIFICESSTGFY